MTMTEHVQCAWQPTRRRVVQSVDKRVELTGAPSITYRGGPVQPVSIFFGFQRVDNGPWVKQVTIYAERQGWLVREFFTLDSLLYPPQWLTDLIENTTPDGEEES